MIITTFILASMLAAQQNTAKPEITGVRHDYLNAWVDETLRVKPGDPVKFVVNVSDIDVTVFKNSKTDELSANAFYSGGFHNIVIDYERRGAQAARDDMYITQDQIIFKKMGWKEDKKTYLYEVTVFIPQEQQVDGAVFVAALEIKDIAPAPWERDKSLFIGATIIFDKGN